MPASASAAVRSFRTEQRLLSRGPIVPRVWQAMRDEWQRRLDRATGQAVRALDHEGVSEDYRMACRGNIR